MAYITVQELRDHLTSDSSYDQNQQDSPAYEAFLQTKIDAAEAVINGYIGDGQDFAFSSTTGERVYTGEDSDTLVLDSPLTALTAIESDETAISTDLVWLEPVNRAHKTSIILQEGSWSCRRQGITITGTWGWGTPPADIKEATIMIAVRLVKGRASGYDDTIGLDPNGVQLYVKALPPQVKLTLDNARKRFRLPEAAPGLGWGGA